MADRDWPALAPLVDKLEQMRAENSATLKRFLPSWSGAGGEPFDWRKSLKYANQIEAIQEPDRTALLDAWFAVYMIDEALSPYSTSLDMAEAYAGVQGTAQAREWEEYCRNGHIPSMYRTRRLSKSEAAFALGCNSANEHQWLIRAIKAGKVRAPIDGNIFDIRDFPPSKREKLR